MQSNATTIPNVLITRLIRGRAVMSVLLIIGASLFIAIAAQMLSSATMLIGDELFVVDVDRFDETT